MENMDFNLDKALELSLKYKQEQNSYAKYKFINLLISRQNIYGDTSILGLKLSTPIYYGKNIVEDVLNDLGYTLVDFSYSRCKDSSQQTYLLSTNFSFT